jgi:hypothetical protein
LNKLLLVVFVLFTAAANATPFTLAGDTVDASIIKTIDNGFGLGLTHGYGFDAPFVVQDGVSDLQQYGGVLNLNVDGGQFAIQYLFRAAWQSGIVFRLDGLDFAGGGALTALNVDTNISGYTLNVGRDFIELALGGTTFNTSTYFTGQFVVASVPLPPTVWLIGIGLIGLAGVSLKRKLA